MPTRELEFNNNSMTESIIIRKKKKTKALSLLYQLNNHMSANHAFLRDAISDAESRGIISKWQAKKYYNIKDDCNNALHKDF